MDLLSKIIAYEEGKLNQKEEIELFQELTNSGLVWQLQGNYARTAKYYIGQGLVQVPMPSDESGFSLI